MTINNKIPDTDKIVDYHLESALRNIIWTFETLEKRLKNEFPNIWEYLTAAYTSHPIENLNEYIEQHIMPTWHIPVVWEMYGTLEVEAPTLDMAMDMISKDEDRNGEEFSLPDESYYVDGTLKTSDEDLDTNPLYQK